MAHRDREAGMMPAELPPPLLSRLGPLVGKLGSPHDGEVLAAARAIGRQLERDGVGFNDLAKRLTAEPAGCRCRSSGPSPEPDPEPGVFRDPMAACRWLLARHRVALSPREVRFIEDLATSILPRGWTLRPRQRAWLEALVRRCGGELQ